MKILVHRIPGHGLAAAELLVGVGWRHEPAELLGVSHFLEHVLYRGSARYPDIESETARYGISFDGVTLPEATGYSFLSLREDFFALLDVLFDLVFHPRMDPESVEAERPIVAGAVSNEAEFAPWEWVRLKVDDMLFEADEFWAMGTPDTVAQLSHDDLLSWHKKYYHGGNATLLVVGDVDEGELTKFLSQKPIPEQREMPQIRRVAQPQRVWVKEADLPTPELFLGFRLEREWNGPALQALNFLLADEPLSLLFRRLRTEAPLAYMVDSGVKFLSDGGRLGIYVGLAEPGVAPRVWEVLLELLSDLQAGKIPEDTLSWAERAARFAAVYERCDPERALAALRRRVLEGGEYELSWEGFPELSQRIFRRENAYLAVYGRVCGWDPERALAEL